MHAVASNSELGDSPVDGVLHTAIIGGGVVGPAILRRWSLAGLRCVLMERGADILPGASKGNSALLHTGFDAPPGSLELACMQAGHVEYLDIRERLNLPLLETSAHVVAWSDEARGQMGQVKLLGDAAEPRPLIGNGWSASSRRT